jgi:hypothetical protein
MAKPKNKLSKHKELLPNRTKLSMEAMFGVTPELRSAAQSLLNALPKENRTREEEIAWTTEAWLTGRLPSEPDMEKSPIGRATLEMLKNSKPMGGEIPAEAMAALESLRSKLEPTVAAPIPLAPGEPAETPNEFASQLANWPPKGSQPKAMEQDEQPRKWVAGTPSTPDKSMRPLAPSDWDSDSNSPIY